MSASISADQQNTASETIRADYVVDGPLLFWLAMRTALLSVITLGLYRFWMTVRLRRHYWTATRIMGDPFEYTGTGLEKLLGFLVAIVILAIYLGAVNLGLAFVGLMSIDDPIMLQVGFNLSLLATMPLIYFATYRARRYVMARTRWRGIRFGMDQAAWGYTWRAMGHLLLTAITLGLLYPRQHFKLVKYKIDRTWFGDQRFHQDGRWQDLLGAWMWVYAIVVAMLLSGLWVALAPENPAALITFGSLVGFGYLGVIILAIRYNVVAFRYFWDHRTLGAASFENDLDTGEVMGVTIIGSMAVGMAAFFSALLIFLVLMVIWLAIVGLEDMAAMFETLEQGGGQGMAQVWPLFAGIGLLYLLTFAFAFAFQQIFVRRPILRRQVAGMQIANAAALARAAQRPHDEAIEAGGFADALGVDIGSGF